jgi:RNA polymerase sigma-70 factor (ECF subfamily)
LGVRPDENVDDAVQQVFEVATRKIDQIELGHERAFLFMTAVRVAAAFGRKRNQSRELADDERIGHAHDPGLNPETLTAERRDRELLSLVLDGIPMELRVVFVLFEIEQLPGPEIAALLEIPVGTVASRLRRARVEFQTQAKRLRARLESKGSGA